VELKLREKSTNKKHSKWSKKGILPLKAQWPIIDLEEGGHLKVLKRIYIWQWPNSGGETNQRYPTIFSILSKLTIKTRWGIGHFMHNTKCQGIL
jgi:hypothetical protein